MSHYAATVLLGLTAPVALSACAAGQSSVEAEPPNSRQLAALERALGDKVPSEPVSCIGNVRRNSAIRISDTVLLYRVSGGLVYKNDLRGSCPGLARYTYDISRPGAGRGPCSGDIIRLIDRDSGTVAATCSLGEFTPYRTPSAD